MYFLEREDANLYVDGFSGSVDLTGTIDPAPTGIKPIDLRGEDHMERLTEALVEKGYVVFEGMQSTQDLLELASKFGQVITHRDSDENGITTITQRPGADQMTGFGGFTDHELSFHTDGTGVPNPADFLIIYCEKPAESGGQSRLVDGRKIYQILGSHAPRFLDLLLQDRTASFGSMGQEFLASIFSNHDGVVSIRYRDDDLVYYDEAIRKNHSRLRNVMASLQDVFTAHEGQGYIVNNQRALHARSAFEGERVMRRVLVQGDFSSNPRLEPGFRV